MSSDLSFFTSFHNISESGRPKSIQSGQVFATILMMFGIQSYSIMHHHIQLVGGIPTPLKNMKVSWDDYS